MSPIQHSISHLKETSKEHGKAKDDCIDSTHLIGATSRDSRVLHLQKASRQAEADEAERGRVGDGRMNVLVQALNGFRDESQRFGMVGIGHHTPMCEAARQFLCRHGAIVLVVRLAVNENEEREGEGEQRERCPSPMIDKNAFTNLSCHILCVATYFSFADGDADKLRCPLLVHKT